MRRRIESCGRCGTAIAGIPQRSIPRDCRDDPVGYPPKTVVAKVGYVDVTRRINSQVAGGIECRVCGATSVSGITECSIACHRRNDPSRHLTNTCATGFGYVEITG